MQQDDVAPAPRPSDTAIPAVDLDEDDDVLGEYNYGPIVNAAGDDQSYELGDIEDDSVVIVPDVVEPAPSPQVVPQQEQKAEEVKDDVKKGGNRKPLQTTTSTTFCSIKIS